MLDQERYAVVSCHVERLLDDRCWRLFSQLQADAPGGFRIAALLRPPDDEAGEDSARWLERARKAAARGPLGHHTHWGGVVRARPRSGSPAERVVREAEWLRGAGLEPTLFCGGGWYLDVEVARAVAHLGYTDCTATSFRPSYLDDAEPQLSLERPCRLELGDGETLLELPSTHSLGMLARAAPDPTRLREPLVHTYFHDTDLLDRTRAVALRFSLRLLARRRQPSDLDEVAAVAGAARLPISRAFAP